jgi:hypothetical protein
MIQQVFHWKEFRRIQNLSMDDFMFSWAFLLLNKVDDEDEGSSRMKRQIKEIFQGKKKAISVTGQISTNEAENRTYQRKSEYYFRLMQRDIKKIYETWNPSSEKAIVEYIVHQINSSNQYSSNEKNKKISELNGKFNKKKTSIEKCKNLIKNMSFEKALSGTQIHEIINNLEVIIFDYFRRQDRTILPAELQEKIDLFNNQKISQDQEPVAPSSELPWGKIVGGIMLFGSITGGGYLIYKKLQSQKKQEIKLEKIAIENN